MKGSTMGKPVESASRAYELLEDVRTAWAGVTGTCEYPQDWFDTLLPQWKAKLDQCHADLENEISPADVMRLRNCPRREHAYEYPYDEPVQSLCLRLLDKLEWLDEEKNRGKSGRDGQKRGPPRIYNASDDAKLLRDWQAAKRQGSTQKQ